jgi:hypothetical protein
MTKRLIITRVNKILATPIKLVPLIISCLILTFLLNSCLSSRKATAMVKAYDNSIFEKQSANSELPPGISLNLQNPLPDSSSVRKSYVMVLPLVVINYFQTNHKLTLGQSSLETPTAELFKSELLSNLNRLQWDVLYQNGYSIDINVHKITSTGVFASGFWAAFAAAYSTGAGTGGAISHSKRIQSEVYVSINLKRNDNILGQSDFIFLVKANESGKLKIVSTDCQSGRAVTIPASFPKLVPGHSFELLIPSTKEVYCICTTMVCHQIVNIVENYLLEFCSL